jgi:hypothetical protein
MSADDFVQNYWNLDVSGTHPTAGPVRFMISCNKYFMNMAKPKDYDTNEDSQKAYDKVTNKQAHVGQILATAQGKKMTVSPSTFVGVEVGKGSPDDMEEVLSTGIETGVLSADRAKVQAWADTYIGVDCTGFVSQYFADNISPTGVAIPNISCPWYFNLAIKNNAGNKSKALIWDFDEVEEDDVLLWMNEAGAETKKPGHIAVVYDTQDRGDSKVLLVAESSGASDNQGHSGPRLNEKIWGPIQGSAGSRSIRIGEGVIVIRPFPDTSFD